MNKKILGISVLLIGLAGLIVFYRSRYPSTSHTVITATVIPSRRTSTTDWASDAMTVNQLLREADLVVRARVAEAPVTRVVRIEAPTLDEHGNIVDSTVIRVLFADTVFDVLETYVGKPSITITVMQTGGFDPTVSRGVEEMGDDPLYEIGDEYILFLVDISGDHIHAPNRQLYLTVNPFGRYGIDGTRVFSYGQTFQSVQLPTTLSELESRIKQIAPGPGHSDDPLANGEKVSLAEAKRRISYPIPYPDSEKIKEVWISANNTEDLSDQSVAIRFRRDLLLIIHAHEEPILDWDKTIANEPVFKKIDVNGNSGMGADPGVTEVFGRPYYYPGSVAWWMNGLDIALYSDTLSLDELLKIAETIPQTNSAQSIEATQDILTPVPTESSTETLTALPAPMDEPTQTLLPTETITPSP